MNGFLDDWNKSRDHKDRIYISYDSTNKNCQSGDIDILEYGKALSLIHIQMCIRDSFKTDPNMDYSRQSGDIIGTEINLQ